MSEASSRNTFRKHVLRELPGVHVQRLEDKFTAGLPDFNLCIPDHGEWWVEAKFLAELPVRNTTPVRVEFRPGQVPWLNERVKAGGRCLVLVRIGLTGWVVFDQYFKIVQDGVPVDTFYRLAKWRGSTLDIAAIFDLPRDDPNQHRLALAA